MIIIYEVGDEVEATFEDIEKFEHNVFFSGFITEVNFSKIKIKIKNLYNRNNENINFKIGDEIFIEDKNILSSFSNIKD